MLSVARSRAKAPSMMATETSCSRLVSPPPIRSLILGSHRVNTPPISTQPKEPRAVTQKMIRRAGRVMLSRVSGTEAASAPARAAISSNMIEPTPADSRAKA